MIEIEKVKFVRENVRECDFSRNRHENAVEAARRRGANPQDAVTIECARNFLGG
jgi:hypothetical protein